MKHGKLISLSVKIHCCYVLDGGGGGGEGRGEKGGGGVGKTSWDILPPTCKWKNFKKWVFVY